MSWQHYAYEWAQAYDHKKPVMVALHGFTGTRTTFQTTATALPEYNWLLIDQLGHGKSAVEVPLEDYDFMQVVTDLAALLEELGITQYGLLGYSMGARIALSWSLHYHKRVTCLILESGSPGLAQAFQRQERQVKDAQLANRLTSHDLVEFVDFWQNLPLFDSQKKLSNTTQAQIRAQRLGQNPLGLAKSLLGMGTGSQPSYWEQLTALSCPTLYIYGQWDKKFAEISQQMKTIQSNIQRVGIENAGHCVHLEQPKVFAEVVGQWVKKEGLS